MKCTFRAGHGSSRFDSVKGILYRVVYCVFMISVVLVQAGSTNCPMQYCENVVCTFEVQNCSQIPGVRLDYSVHQRFASKKLDARRRLC